MTQNIVIDPRRADPRTEMRRWMWPGVGDGVDAAFLLGLIALSLYGLRSTYAGQGYLIVGVVAAVIGMTLALIVNALRWPALVTGVAAVAAYFLFGGALVLRDETLAGVLPSRDALRDLSHLAVDGWKQLLTTLPPVATSGPLLFAPYLLGLAAGAAGLALANRTRSPWAPVLAPAAVLATAILIGTSSPAAYLTQSVVFAVAALCWAALRQHRAAPPVRNTAGRPARLAIGAVLLGLAAGGAALLGPGVPGSGHERVVLRTYVHPPFDLAQYPSPLVGFRKFTRDARLLYSQTLFVEKGLPSGQLLRIATMDSYDGAVWGATNGVVPTGPGQPIDAFSRIGSEVRTNAPGTEASYSVTVSAAYANATDLNAWVPLAGTLSTISFSGPSPDSLLDSLRYNLATQSGIVSQRLATGNTYSVKAKVVAPTTAIPTDATPYGEPTLDPTVYDFVASRATQWSASANSDLGRVEAVAKYLHDNGAYSDGGPGEAQYLPGHSTGRLISFLNAPQVVGDDEQYAAAFALMANYLGVPARVVLTATPEANGVVKGVDVHADVELQLRSASATGWLMVPRELYQPDKNKKPNKVPPQTIQDANAAIVPPPNPVRPPSTLDEPDQPQQNTTKLIMSKHSSAFQLPWWVVALIKYVGVPLLVLLLIALAIVLGKRRRRKRRRTRGSPTDRFANGWREIVDHAHDLGVRIPLTGTRYEQSLALAERPQWSQVPVLAAAADAGVFGPGEPAPQIVNAYWHDVDNLRHHMSRSVGRFRRVRAALSLGSFHPSLRWARRWRATARARMRPAAVE